MKPCTVINNVLTDTPQAKTHWAVVYWKKLLANPVPPQRRLRGMKLNSLVMRVLQYVDENDTPNLNDVEVSESLVIMRREGYVADVLCIFNQSCLLFNSIHASTVGSPAGV